MRKLMLFLVSAMLFAVNTFADHLDSSVALPIPFFEDFTGVPIGEIPAGWERSHPNWGVVNSEWAGGTAPEMQFSRDSRAGFADYRLTSPILDGASTPSIALTFKHDILTKRNSFTLHVQTSIDGGATWQDRWSMPDIQVDGIVAVNLSDLVGHEFQFAFVIKGYAYNLEHWCIDNIRVVQTRELDMLFPYGQGVVAPTVGMHDIPLGHEITLRALPPSTWYAFDLTPRSFADPFRFDPTDLGLVTFLRTIDIYFTGATWADGKWYAANFDPPELYTVNPENGGVTFIADTDLWFPVGLAYDELNDILYGANEYVLYTINRVTGATKSVCSFEKFWAQGIAYGDGVLYALSVSSLYTVNVDNGEVTLLGPTGISGIAHGLVYDKNQGRLFFTTSFQNDVYLVEIDKTNGRAFSWFKFRDVQIVSNLTIPYDIDIIWEFDHWKIDGVFYSDQPAAPFVMNADHTAQAVFATQKPTCTLTMLAPGGTGSGTVKPQTGTHVFPVGTQVPISGRSDFSYEFDYWLVNGIFYSRNPLDIIVINKDVTIQAFFKPQQPKPLPFIEDFTGVSKEEIPIDWARNHSAWGVSETNKAGGVSPEIVFNKYKIGETGHYRLITPRLYGVSASSLALTFKHAVSRRIGDFTLHVETSMDGGITWQDQWSMNGDNFEGEVIIYLDAVVGHEFYLSFVFDGEAEANNMWSIDDVCIAETQKLNILPSIGRGAVLPEVGKHTLPLGHEIMLRALPSATWYAFRRHTTNNPFKFDPADLGSMINIATNTIEIAGGTWADGKWYAITYDPSYLYSVDPENGDLTLIGDTGKGYLSGLAYDDLNDIMYGCDYAGLYTINRSTGAAEYIGEFGMFWGISDIAFGDGILYAHDGENIYTINPEKGWAYLLGPTGFNRAYCMEYDKNHDRLYLIILDGNSVYLTEVDKNNGSVFKWFPFEKFGAVSGLAIPYHVTFPWEFDHWEVDGVFYSNNLFKKLVMDTSHTVQAFFKNDYSLGVRLDIPDTAHPGDYFYVTGYLDNPGEPLMDVPTFFVLEIYGRFWFWPSWAYFDYPDYIGIDGKLMDVPTGKTKVRVVPPFKWPDTGSDIVTGLGFYGAMLNPEMTDIMGEIAYKEWGYGP
ncbi:MAG: hypothetical protein WBM02_08810 [bacterium]